MCRSPPPPPVFVHFLVPSFCSHISGADVFSPYLGEAEAAVRQAFRIARNAAPALLFFDELDAIVCKRGGVGDKASRKKKKDILRRSIRKGCADACVLLVRSKTGSPTRTAMCLCPKGLVASSLGTYGVQRFVQAHAPQHYCRVSISHPGRTMPACTEALTRSSPSPAIF